MSGQRDFTLTPGERAILLDMAAVLLLATNGRSRRRRSMNRRAAWRAKRAVDRKEQAQADDAASRPGYRIQPGGRVTFLPEEGEEA